MKYAIYISLFICFIGLGLMAHNTITQNLLGAVYSCTTVIISFLSIIINLIANQDK